MKRIALAVVAVLGIALAAQAQPVAKTDPEITKLAKAWEAAFNARDFAKLAATYTEDGVVNPPNQPAVRGRAAIQEWAMGMSSVFTSIALTPTESATSGNLAYEAGTYKGTMAAGSDTGKYVVVLRRVGGQWQIAHDIFNSDLPPPPPAR